MSSPRVRSWRGLEVDTMQALTGLDASFLYAETQAAHMHTLKVLVLELPPWSGGTPFDQIRRGLAERLQAIPQLRRRLAHNPLSIGHPVWIEQPSIDPTDHLERAVLPEGATLSALEHVASRFASEQLARDRPPWRILVTEGLSGRRVALVVKIHHALADGGAVEHLLERIFSEDRERHEIPLAPSSMDDDPSASYLIGLGLLERARELARLPATAARTARGLVRRARGSHGLRRELVGVFDAPSLSFNGPLTPARELAFASLPFDELRRVKRAFSCSVNDVVLALVAGSLRRYLHERGEPTDRPLVAAMPVGLHDRVPHLSGNRVSNLMVPIHVDRAHAAERLRVTIESATNAKELHALMGESLMRRWAELARPRPLRWIWKRLVRNVSSPPINLVVSNVPGPQKTLWAGGAKLTELYSVGPILERVGLNITVWSYAGRLNAMVLSCPDHGTDPRAIAAGLGVALRELLAEAAHEAHA